MPGNGQYARFDVSLVQRKLALAELCRRSVLVGLMRNLGFRCFVFVQLER
jgi:hypothetical protein